MMKSKIKSFGIVVLMLLLVKVTTAQLKLPALVCDSMVLQREQPVKIWGWSLKGSDVHILFKGKKYQVGPDKENKWELTLPAMKAGGPFTMTIETSGDTRIIKGIAVGDVWLCSGQSNMGFNMYWAANMFPNDIANSTNSDIREFHVEQDFSFVPKTNVKGKWLTASPVNTGNFTAVGYYMIKALYERYKVPMGIIHSSWGGSSGEAWTSETGLKDFDNYLRKLNDFRDSDRVKSIILNEKTLISNWYKNINEQDKGRSGWADPGFEAAGWKSLQLPGFWESQGAGNIDGVVWLRKEIILTKEMTEKEAIMHLGIIDDVDETYFNGIKIGGKENKYVLRRYKIPSSLLKVGRNLIVVRVIDTDGSGGFIPGKDYDIVTSNGVLPLSGAWQYEIGAIAAPLPVNTFIPMYQQPTALFNGMIAPLIPYTIKGAVWYQGETNAGRAEEYQRLLPSMISDWRDRWGQGDFPFLIAQLANYKANSKIPQESLWAELREAQYLVSRKVPNSGLAVNIDIGEAADVHPLNKKDVGLRLALVARKIAYGDHGVVYSGPYVKEDEIKWKQGDHVF
jgi:sialate O-acetylesterase